jgi:hypothetical protein
MTPLLLLTALALQLPADVCARRPRVLQPSPDLYCIDLHPTPDLPTVSGAVELRRVPTLFGAAVTADGTHLWDLRLTLAGLPDPRTLGNYSTYVAWATTPTLDTLRRLGPVRNGRIEAGRVGLNAILIIVSAERTADVKTREGRIVLRGTSASTLMRPHDFTTLRQSMGTCTAALTGGARHQCIPQYPR